MCLTALDFRLLLVHKRHADAYQVAWSPIKRDGGCAPVDECGRFHGAQAFVAALRHREHFVPAARHLDVVQR